jgi:hypothetical protein
MIYNSYKKYNIYLWAGFASILLTLIRLFYNQPFDIDGIIYLNTAKAFTAQGLHAAMSIYRWPFYSILIALLSKITHLSLLHSTYFLNALLDTGTVIIFIMLIKELGGSRKTQIIGAFIIITFPFLNHFRDDVLRGHGYYPFALLAILYLIRYARSYQWHYAISWALAAILATLFRIEGAVLVYFLPLILLFTPKLKLTFKIKKLIQAYTILLIISCGIILFYPHILYHTSRIPEFIHQLANGWQLTLNTLQMKAKAINTIGIWPISEYRGTSAYFLGGGLVATYLGRLISTFGLLYVILSIYAIVQKTVPADRPAKMVWLYAILLNIILTSIFLCQELFLSFRYIALLCFLLLLGVPFALEKIYINWKTYQPIITGSRWLLPLIIIGLIYTAANGIGHFGPSKTYIVKGGQWINNNTPINSKLYSNDIQLYYYANREGFCNKDNQKIYRHNLHNFNYMALKIPKHHVKDEKNLIAYIKLTPIKIFYSNRGDKLLIFKIK